ncbi:ArsA family ATPase [Corynebacterium fournieri]|uniref:ArsA family ATPase n=2 Tax=Corynebacterium fournieri TaxID=1852390 RepID=UPI0025B47BDA|nr:ArsA family ATPase [Corynebacterium fournieri]WJY98060.1 Arsenical pump-driving ATPase [Corynebacterium fournieri]
MLLEAAPVMFFGGKGGVGKTTVSAAAAVRLAEAGRRVLLVSTDPAHNLGHIWDQRLSAEPTELEPGLVVVELDPAATTERHLAEVERSMRAMMPERMHPEIRRHLDLSRNSPGMHEAAMLEAVAELALSEGFDHIIFDTAPSGHTSRLLALPELMAAYTGGLMQRRERSDKFSRAVRGLGGTVDDPVERRNQEIRTTLLRRRRKFERLREVLTDPAACCFHIVLTAERLPVLESAELHRDLSENRIRVGSLVINRRSPADAGEFMAARRAVEDDALALLDSLLPSVARTELPWLAGEIGSREALAQIAARL